MGSFFILSLLISCLLAAFSSHPHRLRLLLFAESLPSLTISFVINMVQRGERRSCTVVSHGLPGEETYLGLAFCVFNVWSSHEASKVSFYSRSSCLWSCPSSFMSEHTERQENQFETFGFFGQKNRATLIDVSDVVGWTVGPILIQLLII